MGLLDHLLGGPSGQHEPIRKLHCNRCMYTLGEIPTDTAAREVMVVHDAKHFEVGGLAGVPTYLVRWIDRDGGRGRLR